MKKILLVSLALATALATAPAAMATTQTFYFDFTGAATGSGTPGVGLTSGSGFLTGTLVGTNLYELTGGSGIMIDGQAATVIVDTAGPLVNGVHDGIDCSQPEFCFDGLINTSTAPYFVDATAGILFQITSNSDQLNLFLQTFNGHTTVLADLNNGGSAPTDYNPTYVAANEASYGYDTNLDITPTPEPSSLLLMGTGLLLVAGFLFRRKAQQSAL
ncbi:MAG: PEP-CTERM sorting domain-containing protein [Terracidiphilus sp.]